MDKDASVSELTSRQSSDWENWANYWKLLLDCSRPSLGDIEIFGGILNEKIKGIDSPAIVILGSTPELRELCTAYSAEYNANVTCVELVDYMHKAMTNLMFKNNDKEKVVFSNWLATGLPDSFADVIVGDLTEGNITEDLKEQYFLEMNRVLKTGGKYIHRSTAYISEAEASPMLNFAQISEKLNEYKKLALCGSLSIQKAACHLGGELAWDSWYKTKGKLTLSAYKEEISDLDKSYKENSLEGKILEAFHMIWDGIIDKYWDFYDLDKTIDLYEEYFTEVKSHYAKDYPVAKYTPIFEMIKK